MTLGTCGFGKAGRTLMSLCALGVWASLASAETAQMDVGGTTVEYSTEGAGVPILFLHGALADRRAWDAYSKGVAETHRFVAYTQRYFGTAPWPDDGAEFTVERHVADLLGFIEALDQGPVHLVTWSYSGEVGLQAMRERPDLFRSAIHYEPFLPDLSRGLPGERNAQAKVGRNFGPSDQPLAEGRWEDAALRVIEAVFDWPEGAAETEAAVGMWRDNARTLPLQFDMAPYRPLDCETLAGIAVPTLVVDGSETLTRYAIIAERAAQCLANALVVTISDVTHDGPYRDPETLGTLIKAFVRLTE